MSLRGEVFCPNLQFDKTTVDFGCILNDTEVTRSIHMVNESPLAVSYQWSFVLTDQPVAVVRPEPPPPAQVVESANMVVEDLEDVDVAAAATEMCHEDADDVMKDQTSSPVVEVDVTLERLSDSPTDVHHCTLFII